MPSKYCEKLPRCKNAWWCATDYRPSENAKCFDAMTNYDRIRAMTDEELAKTLCAMTNEGCPPWHDADISLCHNHGVCHDGECWKKWLKQEVTE